MKFNTQPETPPELVIDEYQLDEELLEGEEIIDILDDDEDDEEEEVSDYVEDMDEESLEEDTTPTRDDADLVFTKHTAGVLSSAFHPKFNTILATGGLDDSVYVWDVTNGNVIAAIKAHRESVEMVGYSFDGKYLATCDLSGTIKFWNTTDYKLFKEYEMEDELGWSVWHHSSNILISSSEGGVLYLYKVATGDQKLVNASCGSSSICGKLFPDGKRMAVGFTEGKVKIIDLKQGAILSTIKLRDEYSKVSCIDVHRDNNLVICGCENGDILLLSSKPGRILSVLNTCRVHHVCNYIEAIAFCKDRDYQVAASASLEGDLIIWDIALQTARYKEPLSSSINHIVWDPVLPLLYTAHTDGIVNKYDAKSGQVLKEYMGHHKCIYSISLSPDGKSLITTSDDKTVRMYKTEEPQE